MSRKQRIIVSITGIVLVSLILIGLTYGYYLTKIKGNTNSKSISVVTANLLLEYADVNDQLITDSAVEPGKTWTKTFVATNKGNKTVTYGVALENVVNQFERKDDIVYTLDCKQYSKIGFIIDKTNKTVTGTISGTCNGVSEETTFPSIGNILVQNDIADDKAQVYTLVVTYKEMNVDQSVDMNKTFSAKANIVDPNNFDPYGNSTLSNVLIENASNVTDEENSDGFSKLMDKPITSPGNGVSGNVYEQSSVHNTSTISSTIVAPNRNNYITYSDEYTFDEGSGYSLKNPKYAKFSDIYPTLLNKYLVSNTNPFSKKAEVRSYSNLNEIYKITSVDEAHISLSSLSTDAVSINESSLLKNVDDYGMSYYFRGNVKNNYVNFANMCWRIVRIQGDGSIKLVLEDYTTTCKDADYNFNYEKVVFGYKNSSKKLKELINPLNNSNSSLIASLEKFQIQKLNGYLDKLKIYNLCFDDKVYNDKKGIELISDYTNNTFAYYGTYVRLRGLESRIPSFECNGTIFNKYSDNTDIYVGSLTADEVVFAGGKSQSINKNYYLYDKNNKFWWTISPWLYDSYRDSISIVDTEGTLTYVEVDTSNYASSRPSVILKNDIKWKGGTGIKSDAYNIE